MTYLSLFSGIGGFDLGFDRAGMRCVGQVEIDPYCRRVLAKHWPDVPKHDDVTTFARLIADCDPEGEEGDVNCPIHDDEFGDCPCVGLQQVIDEWGCPDIIVGGDPCQANSNAARSGGGSKAVSLGNEFVRIVERLMPRFVVRENPATVRKDAPWTWQRFAGELVRLGYRVDAMRIRACCAGADFRRERMFLLAELPGPERTGLEGDVGPVVARTVRRGHDADLARSDRWSAAPRICGGTVRVPHRVDRLRGLGNAVCPAVAQYVGRRLMESSRPSCGAGKPGGEKT